MRTTFVDFTLLVKEKNFRWQASMAPVIHYDAANTGEGIDKLKI